MLSERQDKLLKLIVEEYIKTALPVGSTGLCDKLNCSSATIRNEMSLLEEYDFLEKTHISSGRVPSEKGYRYYVDNLMKPKEMTGEDVLKLQTIFNNKQLVLSDVITKSLEIISDITNCTSLILGSDSRNNNLKQVEIVPLMDEKIIAIVITDKGHVEHKELNIKNVSISEVKKVVDLINKLLVGTPLSEISNKLEFEIKPIISNYVQAHEALYQSFYNAFNEFSYKSDMKVAGRTKLLNYREFDNASKVKEVLNKFEDQNIVKNIEEKDNDIKVYIGHENNFDDDVSVIKTRYETKSGDYGTIAVVGPKRMDYERIVSLLDYIKHNIER